MILIRVVLPAPFSPTSAWTSPCWSSTAAPLSACTQANYFEMDVSLISAKSLPRSSSSLIFPVRAHCNYWSDHCQYLLKGTDGDITARAIACGILPFRAEGELSTMAKIVSNGAGKKVKTTETSRRRRSTSSRKALTANEATLRAWKKTYENRNRKVRAGRS